MPDKLKDSLILFVVISAAVFFGSLASLLITAEYVRSKTKADMREATEGMRAIDFGLGD